MTITPHNLAAFDSENNYRSSFSRWNDSSCIRSKSLRYEKILGLPFSPDLVPLAAHPAIAKDADNWITVLAYRLLTHLQFTTILELNHINFICSALSQGKAPIYLSSEQRNEALRIYCDEANHALFVELFAKQVEVNFGLNRAVIGRPQFERKLDHIITKYQTRLSPSLIQLFFVIISETLVTKVLNNVPHDARVASVVRALLGDHAADEAWHSVYFRKLFHPLWQNLSLPKKEEIGQLLPQLVWVFLEPDRRAEYSILRRLGFNAQDAEGILGEVYIPREVAQVIRQAASPTLKMFDAAGVFSIPVVEQAFVNYELL